MNMEKEVKTTEASSSKNEIIIDGRLYDITNFIKKHPGGSVITFYAGRDKDATIAFHEFHYRSEKAKKVLQSLPSRPLNTKKDPLEEDYFKLREELVKEGYFEPSYLHALYRMIEVLLIKGLGIWLLFNNWVYLGLIIMGFARARIGWIMHECGHYSLTTKTWLDRRLQHFWMSFGMGNSASYWNSMHNKHHAAPQKLDHDVDLRTLPLVAFTEHVAKNAKGRFGRWWISIQHFMFPWLDTLLVSTHWTFFHHPKHSVRTRNFEELFYIIIRNAILFYIYSHFGGPLTMIWYWLFSSWLGSIYLFGNFTLSHTHRPVSQPDEVVSWIRYASDYTSNISPHWFCDWWMGYLNYQIEHHLFPSMPQFRQKYITHRVKALFEKHGLQYECISYWEACRRVYKNLKRVAKSVYEKEE